MLFQDPERLGSETRPPALQARFLPVVLTARAALPVRLFARTKLNKCQLKKLGGVDLLTVRTSGTFLAPPLKRTWHWTLYTRIEVISDKVYIPY